MNTVRNNKRGCSLSCMSCVVATPREYTIVSERIGVSTVTDIEWGKSPNGYHASCQVHSVALKIFWNIVLLHNIGMVWTASQEIVWTAIYENGLHVNQTRSSKATWLTIIRPYSSNGEVHSHLCPVGLRKARGVGMDHLDDRKGWRMKSSTRCIEFKILAKFPRPFTIIPHVPSWARRLSYLGSLFRELRRTYSR
jgi:hypothetical protein